MGTVRFNTGFYLRTHYRDIADDPESTIEQKFRALAALEKLMTRTKHPGSKIIKAINAKRQKASASPVRVIEKPEVVGKVDSKLLGVVED